MNSEDEFNHIVNKYVSPDIKSKAKKMIENIESDEDFKHLKQTVKKRMSTLKQGIQKYAPSSIKNLSKLVI